MTNATKKTATASPVIADLGKRSRKEIKDLRNGYGKLMDEVQDCVQELIASGAVEKSAQPVVVLVTEKPMDTLRHSLMPFAKIPSFPLMEAEEEEEEVEECEDE